MFAKNVLLSRFGCFCLCVCVLKAQDPAPAVPPTFPASNGFQQDFLNSIGKGSSEWPRIWKPYVEQPIARVVMENSPRLRTLIHDGKLELSMADALTLMLENDLDIVIQRYVITFAETDILRTKSGQAARGFTGALSPGELNSGAIGAGVTSAGSTGGTGNAGGITGGGGGPHAGGDVGGGNLTLAATPGNHAVLTMPQNYNGTTTIGAGATTRWAASSRACAIRRSLPGQRSGSRSARRASPGRGSSSTEWLPTVHTRRNQRC